MTPPIGTNICECDCHQSMKLRQMLTLTPEVLGPERLDWWNTMGNKRPCNEIHLLSLPESSLCTPVLQKLLLTSPRLLAFVACSSLIHSLKIQVCRRGQRGTMCSQADLYGQEICFKTFFKNALRIHANHLLHFICLWLARQWRSNHLFLEYLLVNTASLRSWADMQLWTCIYQNIQEGRSFAS